MTLVFSLSGIYELQGFPPAKESLCFVDCKDIAGTNLYCDDAAMRLLDKRMDKVRAGNAFLRFLDNGNYHYLSFLLARRIPTPFSLLLLDHHPDLQPPAFGSVLSCGSWVYFLLQTCPQVRRVVIAGANFALVKEVLAQGDATVLEAHQAGRLRFVPEEALQKDTGAVCDALKDALFPESEPTLPVYLSVDKDICAKKHLVTNWDQGTLSGDALLALIETLRQNCHVKWIDVCGDGATSLPKEELEISLRANRAWNCLAMERLSHEGIEPSTT